MPTWPTAGSFPQAPRVGTWRRQASDIVSEFKPAQGPARLRRKVTGAVFNCSGTFLLTETQLAALIAFWRDDCDLGAVTFTWTDPEDLVTARTWEWAAAPSYQHATADLYEASVALIRT